MRRAPMAFLILAAMGALLLFATAQQGDILMLSGKKYSIQTNPLEPYLEQHPESRPRSRIISTGLWRGYVASWEIKANQLVLTDIRILSSMEAPEETRWRSVLGEVFPGQQTVLAQWFSGHIIVPTGKLVKYVHMGYASEYKSYLIYWAKNGEIKKQWRGSGKAFKKFRNEQFERFKKTDTYRQAWLKERNDPENAASSDRELEDFLFQFYSEQIMSMMSESIR